MSLPLKLGVFSVLFVGTGGTGVWILTIISEPTWSPLSLDAAFATEYKDKYGETYGEFLVGLSVDNNKEINNLAWWSWSYRKKFLADKEDGAVHKAKGSFSESTIDNEEKLKEECKKAYNGTTDKIKVADNINSNSGEWHKEDVWRYCSAYPTSPKTVGDEADSSKTYTSGKFGHDNKDKLASTKEGNNDWFWILRATAFFKNETDPITNTSNTDFKDLYSKKAEGNWVEKIKKACSDVYDKTSTNLSSYKNELFKWCSFKGKE